jgi:hypothetical protein
MAWYRERPERYDAEITLIRRWYPGARIAFEHGSLVVRINLRSRSTVYRIRLVYPKEFPYSRPRVYVTEPKIKGSPHVFNDGALCIYPDQEGPQTSGKIILDLALKWLSAYEKWLKGYDWPEEG